MGFANIKPVPDISLTAVSSVRILPTNNLNAEVELNLILKLSWTANGGRLQPKRKIIVLALGSDGDINPMLAIARVLHEQGHEVEFLASAYFEEKVQAAQLQFVGIGDRSQYEKALQNKDVWHPYFAFKSMWKILNESLPLTYDVLKSRYSPGDLLVGTSLAFAARMLQ